VVISPVYDDAGSHVGFAKVTRDQTSQREHEEQRRASVAEQSHLLAVTAHELRAPTAVIDGSAAALGGSWDQLSVADRDALLAGIRNSAHRLRRLVSDLTTASRLHGETLQFRLENVSLAETLRNAAARTLAAEPGVQIEVEVTADADFHADASRLDQALDNLLDNAVRHGAPPITLSGTLTSDDVHIRLSDAGPGIPAELGPRLFERFAVAGPSGGTGLGLYLVREIARGHGGDAAYHPPWREQQAAFEIRLPRN
jgi:signal transduction histidine kinase